MANLQACGEPPSRSSSEIHRKSKVFHYFDGFLASSSMPHGLAASIDVMEEQEVYRLIGDEGFARLVSAFYRRVPHDDLLGPMYGEDDLAGAEHRLRDFLVFRFGGPPRYIETRGHPRLRMRHARCVSHRHMSHLTHQPKGTVGNS